ncbi:ADP-ribosyltransferase [Rhodococcoides fascians]|uniref:ADP-ribosyltransferase n=1 Tax=Rhodococcoides fascians TaxID=1828 RepID=UPI0037B44435
MALPDSAPAYWAEQNRTAALSLGIAKRLWLRMGNNFDATWDQIAPTLIASVERAQVATAAAAVDFVPNALADQNLSVDQLADVVPDRLVGVTGGGVPLADALYSSVVKAKVAVAEEKPVVQALLIGGDYLQMLVQSTLSDTGRAAEKLGIASRLDVGFTRMLNPPACSRCIILAGRFYRYSAGFKRHPRCSCKHLPTFRDSAPDVALDGRQYFDSLSTEEQDRTFTQAGAEAIRAGADINQVVNADRGMQVAQVYGRRLAYTTEGTTRRGVAGQIIRSRGRNPTTTPRLMPEAILEIAEDQADALRLLRLNGYILNRDGVPLSGRGSRRGLAQQTDAPTAVPAAPTPTPAPPRRLTEDEGRTLGSSVWRGYAETVDPVDRQAVRTYTGDTYEPINDYLRGITSRVSDDHRDAITRIDRVIENAPRVPENVTVSRAIGADVFGLKEGSNLSGLVGRTFRDDGFASTAMQSSVKSLERYEVELRLDVPSGTRGLYVSSHTKKDENALAVYGMVENELLLGRGIAYEITDAAIEDGRRILSAKLVQQRSNDE